jgi:spore photoproduct lyase
MMIQGEKNVIRERRAAYATEIAKQDHALVRELWAIEGQSERPQVQRIAERSGLPVKWLPGPPKINGERGMDKLLEERNVLLLRDRKSPFIEQFQHPLGRCAKFYKLTAYNNCNFWCEYCYLYLTFRAFPVSTHFVNYDKMFKDIEKFDRQFIPDALRVLNLGELGDPLAVDDITGLSEQLVSFMPKHASRTKLLFLTKSDSVQNLLEVAHGGQTIISFSINTDQIWQYLEHRTPSPMDRLKAARKVQEAGYELRLRIDPMVRYSTWEKDYRRLIEMIFDHVEPSRITIGEYRPAEGLSSHIKSRFPESPLLKVNGSLIAEAGKLRYPREYRIEMFRAIADGIRCYSKKVQIALCKETPQVWKAVGLEGGGLCCNCTR